MNMNANILVALLDDKPLLKKRTESFLEMLEEKLLREIALSIGKEPSTMVEAIAGRGQAALKLLALKRSRRRNRRRLVLKHIIMAIINRILY